MRQLTLALGFGLVLAACATGAVVDPLDLGADPGAGGTGDDGGGTGDATSPVDNDSGTPSYGSRDAAPADTGSAPDTARPDTGAPVDSGGGVDSAPPPPPPPTGLDCTGTYSSQVVDIIGFPVKYNTACDNYYGNGGTAGNPCTPGGNDCAALNGQGGYNPFCCYKPSSGSSCYSDYGGKAQCIPQ